ncbi:DUF2130 domain-containing protein [Jannaschia donghaensis]|uniref:DUF2130 domain-containing protein n=1 Tax=Jannaschia donghaensis TaxID=420998 RepID=A0A0M6YFW6_9RHOB|nr:DUF2130 domain-containing protein [Jannaschia donghaensis]CTQ48669.1 hypothetical protein JDO7802_00673 [Jannaschia donghaensis]
MSDPQITCPDCGGDIKLTESLAGPLLEQTRRDMAAAQADALAKQKTQIEAQAAEAARAAQADKLKQIEEEAAARDVEVVALRANDKAREAKLAEAQAAQARAVKLQADLAEKTREMELTIQTKVAVATEAARAKLAVEAEALAAERVRTAQEAQALKLAEKDTQMEALRRQIDILNKKIEQGSQQRQGEAAELVLEEQLTRAFPADRVEPVAKGIRGADCLLRVDGAGTVIWESKRAANWSRDWLPKLRDDMRTAGADVAVLVSEVRPETCETFAMIDGVWVVAPRYAVPLAHALRDGMLRVAEARGARDGQATKSEMLYDYLTGPQFRGRIEAVVEPFEAMQAALAKEKKHMTAQWATRDKQLEKAIGAMMGMYGDVRGIAGAAIAEIDAFEPDLLEND